MITGDNVMSAPITSWAEDRETFTYIPKKTKNETMGAIYNPMPKSCGVFREGEHHLFLTQLDTQHYVKIHCMPISKVVGWIDNFRPSDQECKIDTDELRYNTLFI